MDEEAENYDAMPFYVEQLKVIHDTEQYILDVNCDHLYEFDQTLYR